MTIPVAITPFSNLPRQSPSHWHASLSHRIPHIMHRSLHHSTLLGPLRRLVLSSGHTAPVRLASTPFTRQLAIRSLSSLPLHSISHPIIYPSGLTSSYASSAIRSFHSSPSQSASQPNEAGRSWVSPDAVPKGESLKKYCRDLTDAAKAGKLDPVIGRDEEIKRTIQVLSRRTKVCE